MPDREKVINGLEVCRDQNNPPGYRFTSCVDDCPYYGNGCASKLKEDAIALLKEQEAVEPEVEVLNEIDRLYKCPKCHKHFFYEKQKYCDQCGQEVKWDGRSKSV